MVNIDCGVVAKVELRASDVIEGAVEGLETGSREHDGRRDQGG
jgi:hypothetical protein